MATLQALTLCLKNPFISPLVLDNDFIYHESPVFFNCHSVLEHILYHPLAFMWLVSGLLPV